MSSWNRDSNLSPPLNPLIESSCFSNFSLLPGQSLSGHLILSLWLTPPFSGLWAHRNPLNARMCWLWFSIKICLLSLEQPFLSIGCQEWNKFSRIHINSRFLSSIEKLPDWVTGLWFCSNVQQPSFLPFISFTRLTPVVMGVQPLKYRLALNLLGSSPTSPSCLSQVPWGRLCLSWTVFCSPYAFSLCILPPSTCGPRTRTVSVASPGSLLEMRNFVTCSLTRSLSDS